MDDDTIHKLVLALRHEQARCEELVEELSRVKTSMDSERQQQLRSAWSRFKSAAKTIIVRRVPDPEVVSVLVQQIEELGNV